MIRLPQATREINGKTYRLTALSAGPGRKMLVRLGKIVGPGLAATLKAAGSGSLLQADVSVLADGVGELCARLSADEFDDVCKIFLAQTEVHTGEGFAAMREYDAFAADYGSLFRLLAAHLEHNYSSFLGVLRLTAPTK